MYLCDKIKLSMKKIFQYSILVVTLVLFLNSCKQHSSNSSDAASNSVDSLNGSVSLSGAFALYPISVKWGEAYKKLHPNVKFNVNGGGAGKGMADVLGGLVDIGNLSRDLHKAEAEQGAIAIPVAIDAVVPTINASNPGIKSLLQSGLTQAQFKSVFVEGKIKNWNEIVKGINAPINVYTRSDAAGAAETWASFCGGKQEDLLGSGVFGDPGLLQAVQRDPSAIGFNNISFVYDAKTKGVQPEVKVLPIDWNANGKIDPEESYYDNLDSIVYAIDHGKYKKPPARLLYFVIKKGKTPKNVIDFIQWVLTDGQAFLKEAGYVPLNSQEIEQAKLLIKP